MKVKHLSAKLENCRIDRSLLSDKSLAFKILDKVIKKLKMSLIERIYYKFEPEGLSVIYLIKESHVAIHTWPEFSLVDVEIVTCKDDANVEEGLKILIDAYKAEKIEKSYWEYNLLSTS
ncbi:MAG: adenosylmethionine decarboxylase [Candidatus Aenigmatarchaeota archaeon]